jgi:hypothetical protein
MQVFKKWLIPIELLNLMLCGLILVGLLWPKPISDALALVTERDYQVLELYFHEEISGDRVPGLWLAMVNQGKITYRKGFGTEAAHSHEPVKEKWLLNPSSYVKKGILNSRTGHFQWQWGVKDRYGMIMITSVGSETGFIMVLNRKAGIKRAGKIAVKAMNEYWGTDLDPEAFDKV